MSGAVATKIALFEGVEAGDYLKKSSTDEKNMNCFFKGKEKLKRGLAKFISSRWMGLVFGPGYGILVYLFLVHLVLAGKPFINPEEIQVANSTVNKTLGLEYSSLMTRDLGHYIGAVSGASTGLGLTISSFFSVKLRCHLVLMIPSLLTKRGRAFMVSFVISKTLEGPISTLNTNLEEVVRSFTCMFEEIKKLVTKFSDQFLKLIRKFKEIIDTYEKIIKAYKEDLETRLKEATEEQRRELQRKARDIERKVKKVKDIINASTGWIEPACKGIGGVASGVSDAVGSAFSAVGNLFGRKKRSLRRKKRLVDCDDLLNLDLDVDTNLKVTDKLKRMLSALKPDIDFVDFDLNNLLGEIDLSSIKNIRDTLKNIFKYVFIMGKYICAWISKVYYLSIFLLVIDAIKYQRAHLVDDEFDNKLINGNLKKCWKINGQKKLTPMRKWEVKERYQVSTNLKLSKKELMNILKSSIPIITLTLTIASIVLLDFLVTHVLLVFKENASFGISFPGMEQGLSFKSFLAIEDDMKWMKIEAFDLTTDPCMPNPQSTPLATTGTIIFLLFVCGISTILDAYFSRLRTTICNIFHPDRAEERASYLYKKICASRRSRHFLLNMLLSRELGCREKNVVFWSAWIKKIGYFLLAGSTFPIWLLLKILRRDSKEKETCLGCNNELIDPVDVAITHYGERREIQICFDCAKDA